MLSNYFCTKQVLKGTFLENPAHKNPIYTQIHIEPKYGAFYLNNKVRVHGLVLLVELSVAPPFAKK